MVVAVNGNWKLPIAYFFIDSLNGGDRANLVTQCLCRLYDLGVTVTSITTDGASSNLAMFRELGASTDPNALQSFFPHPSNNAHKIHIFLDVCHMLKLVRNTLASQTLINGDGKHIKWQYVEELHKLQEGEGLKAAHKLRTPHIEWQRLKMKVNLAAQVISNSVGNALELCLALNLPQFKGCKATVVFLKTFDHLFDILN